MTKEEQFIRECEKYCFKLYYGYGRYFPWLFKLLNKEPKLKTFE